MLMLDLYPCYLQATNPVDFLNGLAYLVEQLRTGEAAYLEARSGGELKRKVVQYSDSTVSIRKRSLAVALQC